MRNGYAEERKIYTAAGGLKIRRPRVDDRKARGEQDYEGFRSWILPRYMRKSPTLERAVALLYLKGISTNDFPRPLEGIFGGDGSGVESDDDHEVEAGMGAGVRGMAEGADWQ